MVPALLTVVLQELEKSSSSSMQQLVGLFKSFLDTGKWGYIMLRSLIQNETEERSIIDSMVEFVVLKGPSHVLYTSFRLLMQILYDVDLLSEEVLLEWAQTAEEGEGTGNDRGGGFDEDGGHRGHPGVTPEARRALMLEPQLQAFFAWLQEDEEDDSDEDDEDDDDDDESDSD